VSNLFENVPERNGLKHEAKRNVDLLKKRRRKRRGRRKRRSEEEDRRMLIAIFLEIDRQEVIGRCLDFPIGIVST